jgi:hypothetical protein
MKRELFDLLPQDKIMGERLDVCPFCNEPVYSSQYNQQLSSGYRFAGYTAHSGCIEAASYT